MIQVVVLDVLLFPFLTASQRHSTNDIVKLLRPLFVTLHPPQCSLGTRNGQSSIGKQRRVVKLISINTTEGPLLTMQGFFLVILVLI